MNALNSHGQVINREQKLRGPVENEHQKASAENKHSHDGELIRLAEIAEQELRHREIRSRHLPQELIGDASWGMLLDLFASEQRGRTRSEADLCSSSLISPTTAMRWLLALEQAGFLRREKSLTDPTHRYVSLTEKGQDSVSSILGSHL